MKTKSLNQLLVVSVTGLSLLGLGCADAGKNTGVGAAIGVAAGAAVGAVVGHQSGDRKKGALVGAALGGAIGAAHGHKLDKQAKELEKIAETKRTEQGILTKLKGDILFPSGEADLKSGSLDGVNKISNILKKYPENRITVLGHTDSTGQKKTNAELSVQRAQAVKQQMVQAGVPETSITVVGKGDTQPISSNKTPEGRAQNRRVELVITMPETASNK